MKLNLFFLSAAAMVNTASGAADYTTADLETVETVPDFVILATTAISTVPFSTITGDIAVSATSAAITGFSLITADISVDHQIVGKIKASDYPASIQVVGNVKASDYTEKYYNDDDVEIGDEVTAAVEKMEDAYDDVAKLTPTTPDNLYGGLLGSQTLTSGVYFFESNVAISAGELTFDGENDPDAVFVIQVKGNLLQSLGTNVKLIGMAKAENIYWSVGGAVTVGAGAHLEGILLVKTAVTFVTGASLNGRIFAQTAVTLGKATITQTPL